MKTWEIWSEGYRATGESSKAFKLGEGIGETFHEACIDLANRSKYFNTFFNEEQLTHWACRLYATEWQAREVYG